MVLAQVPLPGHADPFQQTTGSLVVDIGDGPDPMQVEVRNPHGQNRPHGFGHEAATLMINVESKAEITAPVRLVLDLDTNPSDHEPEVPEFHGKGVTPAVSQPLVVQALLKERGNRVVGLLRDRQIAVELRPHGVALDVRQVRSLIRT